MFRWGRRAIIIIALLRNSGVAGATEKWCGWVAAQSLIAWTYGQLLVYLLYVVIFSIRESPFYIAQKCIKLSN